MKHFPECPAQVRLGKEERFATFGSYNDVPLGSGHQPAAACQLMDTSSHIGDAFASITQLRNVLAHQNRPENLQEVDRLLSLMYPELGGGPWG